MQSLTSYDNETPPRYRFCASCDRHVESAIVDNGPCLHWAHTFDEVCPICLSSVSDADRDHPSHFEYEV